MATPDSENTQDGVALDQLAEVSLHGRSLAELLAITPGGRPVASAQPNAVAMSGVPAHRRPATPTWVPFR